LIIPPAIPPWLAPAAAGGFSQCRKANRGFSTHPGSLERIAQWGCVYLYEKRKGNKRRSMFSILE